ncbi:MAG: dihydrolipoamide acetyltransferase family protein [Hyphomonadaceae bacterium]
MGEYTIKLPDVGEGVAEAELVEWLVEDGQSVREDDVLAAVMTDKATVEIPAPTDGVVIWRGGKIGEILAVGSPLIKLEVVGEGNADEAGAQTPVEAPKADPAPKPEAAEPVKPAIAAELPKPAPAKAASMPMSSGAPRAEGEKPLASPAIRKRALEGGVDLRRVVGSGPAGRISHDDLDAYFNAGGNPAATRLARTANTSVKDIPMVGLRRKIAQKMAISKSRIPHITYVDEIDVTALETLRGTLNAARQPEQPKLTLLPFLMRAMAVAIAEQPQMNSTYDDDAGVVHQHGGIHMGVAAQTANGLVVPVVKHVEARGLWDCAGEVGRLAEAAKNGTAGREELSGSTITITSLGKMGGVVTTPVINHPEVAIIGVNKMRTLPQWDGTAFQPRQMMNLSSSFDHRIIDGWDAAVFIQKIKSLLEAPAMIFIED